jgi:hypothetical protein
MIKIITNNRPMGTHPFASAKNHVNNTLTAPPAKMGIADVRDLPPLEKNLHELIYFLSFFR